MSEWYAIEDLCSRGDYESWGVIKTYDTVEKALLDLPKQAGALEKRYYKFGTCKTLCSDGIAMNRYHCLQVKHYPGGEVVKLY